MVISKKLQEALNNQINRELYSAYLYAAMAAYFESVSLRGFAHWMMEQAKEEVGHAMKLYEYLVERGGRVVLGALEAPPAEWKSPVDVFETTYEHEQKVTQMINDLVKLAREGNDYATEVFLQWFVSEQVEEEASVIEVLEKLKLVEDAPGGLFMLDRELGQRG